MKTYEEFCNLKRIDNDEIPYIQGFEYKGNVLYVEPTFHTQLLGMKQHHHDKFSLIISNILSLVEKNKKVVFVGDFENPYIEMDGFVYLEITDVTDPLLIFVEDKSRGSDYGD